MIILYYYRQLWPKITPHPTWAMGDQAATGTSDEAEESIQHRGQPLHSLGGQSWVKMSVFFVGSLQYEYYDYCFLFFFLRDVFYSVQVLWYMLFMLKKERINRCGLFSIVKPYETIWFRQWHYTVELRRCVSSSHIKWTDGPSWDFSISCP